ncbi:MAG: ABC transporter permease [Proteobacteria bacterium]|jgi:peptide/nickel transport system permease protein|nr:ABC transporter permease [Pseudomonadota bacterium]MDA0909688.1 ABC transporter permease [Pseudomonadota bacterium]MDA1319414.1 ABC transporter permease [Pseudomonadota bacterium]
MPNIISMIIKRLGLGVLTLLLLSLLIFLSVEALPGDLAETILGQQATPETVAAIRKDLGLDQPPITRYLNWLGGVLQGDFGNSLALKKPISSLIAPRIQNTLFLTLYTAAIAVPLSIILGLAVSLFRNSYFDRITNTTALAAISMPEFFVGYIMIYFFALSGYFPSMANINANTPLLDKLYLCFLPALTLTLVVTAHMMRMTRAAIINVLALPYIEMARLKGAKPSRIIVRHALPNAIAPIVNVVALNLAYLITGVVIVEIVFVFPGLGQLMVDGVKFRDVPVVQATALIFASAYVGLNLLADIISTISNPRLMRQR